MKHLLLAWLSALLLAAASARTWAAESTPAIPAALAAQLQAILQASAIQGAAVVLVDATGPTGAWFYGQSDAGGGEAITPATCFRAGSVSKTFTAMLALRLADEGKLDLDAPLPADLQPPAPPGARCGPVNVAQLLEHTGGLAGSHHADYGAQQPDAPVAARAAAIAQQPLRWCPGLHYSYANEGSTLAAAVLERAGGADFDTLMQREVFAPLGMDHASFSTAAWPRCLSRSYEADGRTEITPWQLPVRPAGALIATPLELAQAVGMLLRYGAGPEGPVLQACSAAHLAVGLHSLSGRAGALAGTYGRGLFRFVAAGRLMTGHWGRIDGFQTTLGFAPEVGRGMVIMVNTADRRAMHALREAVAAHLWQGSEAPVLPPAARPAHGIAGWYANASHDMALRAPWVAMLDVVRIEQDDTGLTLRGLWPGAASRRVLAVGETSFREAALPLPSMAFARSGDVAGGDALPVRGATDGTRWWIDGESYREVAPAWATAQLAVLLLGILSATVSLAWWVLRVARGVFKAQAASSRSAAWRLARAPIGWLALSGAAYLWVIGGYAAFGVFSVGDALAQLGRMGALSLSLAAGSVIGPFAAVMAMATRGAAVRGRDPTLRLGLASMLIALGVLFASLGWLPLMTWRSA